MNNSLSSMISDLKLTAPDNSKSKKNKPVQSNGIIHENQSNLSDPAIAGRPNPWNFRQPSTSHPSTSYAECATSPAPHVVSTSDASESDRLLEAEAWPEPSVPFDRPSSSFTNNSRPPDDRPKNKKSTRNWKQAEIDFGISFGGRNGNGVYHSYSKSNGHQTNYPRGVGRRGGSSTNGSFNRGRRNRPNNDYSQPRQFQRVHDNSQQNETETVGSNNSRNTTRPIPITTVSANCNYRGGYAARTKRPGPRNGHFLQSSNQSAPSSIISPAPVIIGHPTGPPLAQLTADIEPTYLYPTLPTPNNSILSTSPLQLPTAVAGTSSETTNAAVIDGKAAALQSAIVLPSVLANPSSQSSPVEANRSSGVIPEVVSLDNIFKYIEQFGWSNTDIPILLQSDPSVQAAMHAAGVSGCNDSSEGESANPSEKKRDVVSVCGKIFFVPRNAHLTKFLRFTSRDDYIRHHVDYYFSDANLNRDSHLIKLLSENNNCCPIENLLQFNRLRWIATTEEELLRVANSSSVISVAYDSKSENITGIIRRTSDSPKVSDSNKNLSGEPQTVNSEYNISPAFLPSSLISQPYLMPHQATPTVVAGHFMPFASVPGITPFYGDPTPGIGLVNPAAAAAGDQAVMNGVPTDPSTMYYRALLAATAYPPSAHIASHMLPYGGQQHPFFFPPLPSIQPTYNQSLLRHNPFFNPSTMSGPTTHQQQSHVRANGNGSMVTENSTPQDSSLDRNS